MATNVSSPLTPAIAEERIAVNRILPVGLLAILLSIVANLIVQAVGVRLMDISPVFEPLASPTPIALFTAIGVGLAVAVFALVTRRAARPLTTFRTVATVVLIVSVIPNLLLLVNAGSVPGASVGAVATLIVTHIVAYGISVGLLTTLTRASS